MMHAWSRTLLALTLAITAGGCAAFRASVREADPQTTAPLGPGYDQRDLYSWTDEMTDLILKQFPPAGETAPVLAVFGIQNRSKTHLDTQALADTIATRLLDSGKVRLANVARRDELLAEQGFQVVNATPESRVTVGRQLGARYMLTGSLTEIEHESARQVRVSRKQDIFYQLTLEITDIETGLIVLRKQVDRMRRQSVPIIGW